MAAKDKTKAASQKTAITVDGVHKNFVLPHEKKDSVKRLFTGMFKGSDRRVEMQHALQDISFEVKEGEFFGIVGRNGSGKSTLLKMLAGIYQPTKGKIKVNGKLVPFIELGVGFNPELTGRENVYLNGALLGFSKKEIDARYHDIVKFAELERFMDKQLKNYSSGMQVRLAFSVAIIADADILLVDEVLAVGDADFQRKCFEYFKRLKRNKKTVVFVSHDMAAVQQYCDRALLIDKSEIVEIGTANHISVLYSKVFLDNNNSDNDEPKKKGKLSPSGEERWGDNWAKWTSVKTEFGPNDKLGEPESIVIHASGKAIKDIDFPIFGFSVKNSEFLQLTGTNTVRLNQKVKPLAAGEAFSLTWTVPNIFNTGKYYVDCTIAHDQATNVSDRWPDAASFKMTRTDNNPYTVRAGATFTYK